MRCIQHALGRSPTQVLIAEDDPNVRSLVLDVVKDLGHAPSCAADGAEALDLYQARGADVVVSDWMMPRLDGVELCRSVRSQADAPYTYFILLTALGDDEHRLAGMQAGADDYLPKPFTLADMEARLIAAERVTTLHRRREALLRQTRRFAAETDARRLLESLLHDAISLVDGEVGSVARWHEDQHALLAVAETDPPLEDHPRLSLGEGVSGRAAEQRAPVLQRRTALDAPPADHELVAAIGVPMLHESRLIGTVAVGTRDPRRVFGRHEAEVLELLASTAAGALVALERARLDGVLLAARTAQHELNNQLAVARGYAELLVNSPELPVHLANMADEVMRAADEAARTVRQLRNLSKIREHQWPNPADSTINLAASAGGTRPAYEIAPQEVLRS